MGTFPAEVKQETTVFLFILLMIYLLPRISHFCASVGDFSV